jgi:hypothetical protein
LTFSDAPLVDQAFSVPDHLDFEGRYSVRDDFSMNGAVTFLMLAFTASVIISGTTI